jgi:hypothetical protein
MTARADHNNPPADHAAPLDDLAISLAAVVEDAGPWLTGAAIPDDDAAKAVADLVTRADAAMKAVKAAEEVEKRPHLDATNAIRKRYADSYADAVKKAEAVVKSGKALLLKWQQAKEAARAAEAAKLAAEAAAKEAEARAALQQAGGDLDARIEAEALAESAKTTAIAAVAVGRLKVAPQVGGRSLRKRKVYRRRRDGLRRCRGVGVGTPLRRRAGGGWPHHRAAGRGTVPRDWRRRG